MRKKILLIVVVISSILLFALILTTGCAQTRHASKSSSLGVPLESSVLRETLSGSGPITLKRIASADWAGSRAGLINLESDAAKEAKLEDGDEAIQVFMYALRHPEHGLFLIDTGVDRATAQKDKSKMATGWFIRSAMNLEALKVHVNTKDWIASQQEPLAGVFLTHLHLDHAMGLPDIPKGVPIYTGRGEAEQSAFLNLFTQPTINRSLEGRGAMEQLQTTPLEGTEFEGMLDVFGDGSLIALHVPGHTAGSLAFLLKTTEGSVLITGDACHTKWGWDHSVEPGSFNNDMEQSADSFRKLQKLAKENPDVKVYLGHQNH